MKENLQATYANYRKAAYYYLAYELFSIIPSSISSLIRSSMPGSSLFNITSIVFLVLFLKELSTIAEISQVETIRKAVHWNIGGLIAVATFTLFLTAAAVGLAINGGGLVGIQLFTVLISLSALVISYASVIEMNGHMELVDGASDSITHKIKMCKIAIIIAIVFTLVFSVPTILTMLTDDNLQDLSGLESSLGSLTLPIRLLSSALSITVLILHFMVLKGISTLGEALDNEPTNDQSF